MLHTTSNCSISIHQFRNDQSHEIQIFDLNSFNYSLQIIKLLFFWLNEIVYINLLSDGTKWGHTPYGKYQIQACVHEHRLVAVWECLNIINKILIHLKHPIHVKWGKIHNINAWLLSHKKQIFFCANLVRIAGILYASICL